MTGHDEAAHRQTIAPAVVIETRDEIVVIRLNRPAERNALSVSTLEELDRHVSALIAQTNISALIFTGTDNVFASGANIRELSLLTPTTALEFSQRGQRLFQKIADAPQLTIAAINGYCMGGGLDLALSCNLRIACPSATFAHPGARLGIITGWGGTQLLPKLIGAAHAIEMFAMAKHLTGSEAYDLGLINCLRERVLDCAIQMAVKDFSRG
jgi:enoyl-CoA hydratase